MTAPAVEVTGLRKRFGEVNAVDGVSFTVERGQVCGLLGPNGAGKTTCLRMLLGLVHPDDGEARLLGQKVTPGHDVLSKVGALVEGPAFVPYLPGTTNLRLFWEAGGAKWPPSHLDEALGAAKLGPAVNRKVKGYSHGMRQRLGLAQALMTGPEVLVLDEPSTGLDPQETKEIRELIGQLAEEGTTILLSSHLLSEVEQICTHAVVMDRGKIVTTGTVEHLIGASGRVYVEVDNVRAARDVLGKMRGVGRVRRVSPGLDVELDGITRSTVVKRLVRAGVGVETITTRNRLEDAFLNLLGEQ